MVGLPDFELTFYTYRNKQLYISVELRLSMENNTNIYLSNYKN